MIYLIARAFVSVCFNIYYKIDLKGLNKFPRNKPIIIAPNHSNGFVDPLILGILLPQKIRFFARGDVFKGKFAKWMLDQLSVSPMYRIQEGYSEIKKNDKSFEESRDLLKANRTLLMFPEGVCVQERRLRPLKKGLARIAFQTLESFNYSTDILIVPIGINYLAPRKFRSKVFIEIGEPISVKEFGDNYKEDRVKAINSFTKSVEEKLAEEVHIIHSKGNDHLVAEMEEIFLYQWLKDKKLNPSKLHNQGDACFEMIDMVNTLDEKKPEVIASLKKKVNLYVKHLNKNNLRDHLLREENINKMNFRTFLLEYLIICFGTPFYYLGLLLNKPPYYLAEKLTDIKVKKVEFYASFRSLLSLLFWIIYFFIQLIIFGLLAKSWLLLFSFAIVIILSGLFSLTYYPIRKKIKGRWHLLRMVRKNREAVEHLVNERAEVMKELTNAKNEYLSIINN